MRVRRARTVSGVRTAHTLAEMLVVLGLFSLVLLVVLSCWASLRDVQRHQQAYGDLHREQQLFLNYFRERAGLAAYVFWHPPNPVLGGHTYVLPGVPSSAGGRWPELLFARPTAEDRVELLGVYLRPRSRPDARNPEAQELVVYERPEVAVSGLPLGPDNPDLSVLGAAREQERVFNLYGVAGGLSFGFDPDRRLLDLRLDYRMAPAGYPPESGQLSLSVSPRNLPSAPVPQFP